MLHLPACESFSEVSAELPEHEDASMLGIRPTGKGVTLDSLVFGKHAAETEFYPARYNVKANRILEPNKMILSYEGISTTYTIEWSEPAQMVRRYYYDDIGRALTLRIHDHVSEVLSSKDSFCVYENILSEPIYLEPATSKSLSFSISSAPSEMCDVPNLYSVISNSTVFPMHFLRI